MSKKLKKFQVNRYEVYIQPVIVEAETREEAVQKVENCEGEVQEDQLQYSYTLESDEWAVAEL